MRRYNGIVESECAPSKFDLWMFRGSLKYFGPNGWANVSSGETQDLAKVAYSGDYSDLINTPTIPEPYTLPAATTSAIGGVKKATNVSNLTAGAELATVITQVNAILSALKVADIMVKDAK